MNTDTGVFPKFPVQTYEKVWVTKKIVRLYLVYYLFFSHVLNILKKYSTSRSSKLKVVTQSLFKMVLIDITGTTRTGRKATRPLSNFESTTVTIGVVWD